MQKAIFKWGLIAAEAAIGIHILTRWGKWHFHASSVSWQDLLIAILFWMAVAATGAFLARSVKNIPLGWGILILVFGLYWLSLLNILFLHINPRLFVMIIFGLAALTAGSSWIASPIHRPMVAILQWPILILVCLWGIYSLMLFIGANMSPGRNIYADEAFWVGAAMEFVKSGFLLAHLQSYHGSGSQPFAISFLAALPDFIFGHTNAGQEIFFMPLFVILLLGLFMVRLLKRPYCFLFFFAAMFVTFSNNSWVGRLMYQLTYGEGICSLFLLWFLVAWQELLKGGLPWRMVFLMGIGIGLMALSKVPLASFYMPIAIIVGFSFIFSMGWQKAWKKCLVLLMVSLLPCQTWGLFIRMEHVPFTFYSINWLEIVPRLMHPDTDLLQRVFKHWFENAGSMLYFLLLALLSFFTTCGRRVYLIFPMALMIGVLLIFYGYSFYYGMPGKGDHASALRYLMTVVPAIFYLGAEGFETLVTRLEQQQGKAGSVFFLIGLVLILVKVF